MGHIRRIVQKVERYQPLLIMHSALAINDIVHTILQHVKSSGTDLINVAMTCSALSGPALDILWSEQSSLSHLVMCLPQDTWEATEERTIKFTREPLPTDWERVRIYASRIRRIVVKKRNYIKIPPRPSGPVLQQLFTLFPPAILFPNLCVLHFDAVSRLPEIRVLSTEAPCLRNLMIRSCQGLSTCRSIISKLPRLNRLCMRGIDMSLMRQSMANIQHSRCLRTLSLNLYGQFDMENQPSGNTPIELKALTHLFLYGARLQHSTSFLLQVSIPHLSTIRIGTARTSASPEEITAFFESLITSCQTFGFLEKLSMIDHVPGHWQDHESQSELHSRIFRPLLQFRRLSTVEFFDIGKFRLDDRFIEDVAVAWPYLRVLKFASEKLSECEVQVAAFPTLTFDATHYPTLPRAQDGTPELWAMQTALSELHVGHSKVSPASQLHLFLAMIFPNLADLSRYQSALSIADGIAWRHLIEDNDDLLRGS
ncbi:hypothetical protein BD769DRAFT_1489524 [Suillus cothurnatus]|nr:hypothetical protein BD769DRAFT_1489524 [Suillus cothurnatus]